MTRSEILDFANQNPICFLATSADNVPFCRAMMVAWTDENGILFSTGSFKQVHAQLKQNPKLEVCFYNPVQNKQLRLSAQAEQVTDTAIKEKLIEKFPFLKPVAAQHGMEALTPFYIKHGKATTWIMEENAKPKEFFDF